MGIWDDQVSSETFPAALAQDGPLAKAMQWLTGPNGGLANSMGMRPWYEQSPMDIAMGFAPSVGVGAIRAWHASPHDFNKFDMSKVGSGQGAASYGHGIYAADSPRVSGPGGQYDREFTAGKMGKNDLNQLDDFILQSIRSGKGDIDVMGDLAKHHSYLSFDDAYQALQNVHANKAKIYEVDINANPAHLLDWDKPLSQQSEKVREALLSQPNVARSIEAQVSILGDRARDPTGQSAYAALTNWRRGVDLSPPSGATDTLREAGIPGIRYLDQGSRNAGGWHITPPNATASGKWMVKSNDYNSKGLHFDTEAAAQAALQEKIGSQTSNYVMFDDKLIDIIRKYGLAGLAVPGALAPYAASQGDY